MRLKPITAWSFSRYKLYATCPRQFKYKVIEKRPEVQGPAMMRGDLIHKGIEAYLKGKKKALPKDPDITYGPLLTRVYKTLRKEKAATELELAIDKDWQLVDWFDPRTWFRAKIDAVTWQPKIKLLGIYDNKTGKERPEEHAEQLETYVIIAPAKWPEVEAITASMLYVDFGRDAPARYADLDKLIPRLRKKWTKAVQPMFKDKTFKPRPGWACRYCSFSKAHKGGPCDAG